jgi:hypothetical protein
MYRCGVAFPMQELIDGTTFGTWVSSSAIMASYGSLVHVFVDKVGLNLHSSFANTLQWVRLTLSKSLKREIRPVRVKPARGGIAPKYAVYICGTTYTAPSFRMLSVVWFLRRSTGTRSGNGRSCMQVGRTGKTFIFNQYLNSPTPICMPQAVPGKHDSIMRCNMLEDTGRHR